MKHFAGVTRDTKEAPMSAPIDLQMIAFVVVLIVLGMAAAAWGVDSRSPFSNDHNR